MVVVHPRIDVDERAERRRAVVHAHFAALQRDERRPGRGEGDRSRERQPADDELVDEAGRQSGHLRRGLCCRRDRRRKRADRQPADEQCRAAVDAKVD